jgi:hypothetical protein
MNKMTTSVFGVKITPWFDGKTKKPSRLGVYMQRSGICKIYGYQYWDGKQWYPWSPTVEGAYRLRRGFPASSNHQDDDWIGTLEPETGKG